MLCPDFFKSAAVVCLEGPNGTRESYVTTAYADQERVEFIASFPSAMGGFSVRAVAEVTREEWDNVLMKGRKLLDWHGKILSLV
jgi:hypothetical protein